MLRALLRRDRGVVLACLVTVITLAWTYLLLGAGIKMEEMDMGGGQIMMMAPLWTLNYAALIFLMWAIMMVAMMLPSAAPTILLVGTLARDRIAPVTVPFTCGYVLVWTGFSLAATALQFGLDRAGALSDTMVTSSARLAGIMLIVAGAYQWTPLKQVCLRHCRSPLAFLLRRWRQGAWGAFTNGIRHGFFCLGCCWVLMVLLFVGGLMNLLWIAVLALLVLLEKTVPWGGRTSRVAGAALFVWGAVTLVST
jgi:predicted metal-binding membrane protein